MGLRRLFGSPGFPLLFIGMTLSMFGDRALFIAMGIWVKDLTGSNGAAGAIFFVLTLPSVVAPVGGYVVDRMRRRPFLITVNLGTAVAVATLVLVAGRGQLWLLYAVGFAYGVALLAISAAMNGLLKAMMPETMLVDANSALQTVQEGLRLVAPLAGAGLYAAFGGAVVALLDAATFVAAAACLALVRVREPRPQPVRAPLFGEMSAGVRHLWATLALRRTVLGCGVAFLVVGFGESIIFAVTDQGLHRPTAFIGVLLSMQGVGAVIGGLTAAAVVRRLGEQPAVGAGLGVFAAGLTLLVASSLWVVLAAFVIAGVGLPWAIVGYITLLQRRTPQRLIGRVSSAADVIVGVPQTLSIALGAVLIGFVDYRLLLVVIAGVVLACTAYLVLRTERAPAMADAVESLPVR